MDTYNSKVFGELSKPGSFDELTTLPDVRSYISIGVVEHGGGVAFETDLQPEQYAYRPGRSTNDAVKRVHGLLNGGHDEVVDGDLSNYLEVSSYCPQVYTD